MNGPTTETVSEKKHNTLIYIFNMSEDVWPFISAMSDANAKSAEILENVYLGDLRMFQFADESEPVLYVTPHGVSDAFLEYYKSLFPQSHLSVLTTGQHSGVISEDMLHDVSIMNALVDAANSSKKLTITSYAVTPQLYTLVRALREKGLTIVTPEAPDEEDAWTVNFYGSKSGIRQLAQQSENEEPDFKMADGVIAFGIEDASKIAAIRYVKEQGVVIKTNKGHSGMGVEIFRPGDLPEDFHACQQKIYELLMKDKYWELFPIIIEKFINVNTAIAGGNPNVEFKISRNGHIDFLYQCGVLVTNDGVFHGIEVGDDIMPERIAAQIKDTGFYIAERFAAAGYRGYFDVDCVAGKNGDVYVAESNVRSTGGTFVYKTALALFGENFMFDTYLFSNNGYDLSHLKRLTFPQLLDRLSPVLFSKETKEGVIVTSENLLRMQKLAFILFAKTKKRAQEIEAKMADLLGV
ncbi:MAG TPA: hypothetical protein VJB96_02570 [Patescibacteria group bacterium]|nr:hypothetical protein [Patescibacteria group bacterium]